MRPDRKAAVVLAAIAASEGTWVVFEFAYNRSRFLRYLGFSAGRSGTVAAWLLALIVTVAFVAVALRLPSVRQNVFRPSWLKLLGIAVAVTASILEEVMFRKWIMDSVAQHGGGVVAQIAVAALTFGVAHGVWGIFGGSLRAAIGAMAATSILGGTLAVIYIVAGRSLAPCIAAHFAINALIEPGLALAATHGEMSR